MGRLEDLRVVDPVLTTLARGYTNNEFVGDKLFPRVFAGKEAGKIPQFGKEAFKLYNSKRAIRAGSNRISPGGRDANIDFVMDEQDLEYPIDYREKEEDIFDAEQNATMVVSGGLALNREYEQATIAQNLASYAAGSKITLSGTSQFTHADSLPIAVVETGKKAISNKIGKDPNTLIIGDETYRVLINHAKLIERIKYSMKGVLTVDLLKELFGIENIFVGKAIYADDADAFVKLWSDNMVLAYVPQGAKTYYEPSYGYTIGKKNYPQVDKRLIQGGKIELVRNTDFWIVKLVGAIAGYLINDTNA
jgi:hypothetical protein